MPGFFLFGQNPCVHVYIKIFKVIITTNFFHKLNRIKPLNAITSVKQKHWYIGLMKKQNLWQKYAS